MLRRKANRSYHFAIAHGISPDLVCFPRAVLPENRDLDDGIEQVVLALPLFKLGEFRLAVDKVRYTK